MSEKKLKENYENFNHLPSRSFSSLMIDEDSLTRNIIEAVRFANVNCVLAKGWTHNFSKVTKNTTNFSYPDFIYPVETIPHDWLFPKMSMIVHHGM